MCKDGKVFTQYATAEKELCEMAGEVLTNIINEIETRHGIRIAELRVTMDRAHSLNGWPAANCVMVREVEVEPAPPVRVYTPSSQEANPYVCSRYPMLSASR